MNGPSEIPPSSTFSDEGENKLDGQQRRRSLIHQVYLSEQLEDACQVPVKSIRKLSLETVQYFAVLVEFVIVFSVVLYLVGHTNLIAHYDLTSLYAALCSAYAYIITRISVAGYKRESLVIAHGVSFRDFCLLILSFALGVLLALSLGKEINLYISGFCFFTCLFVLFILHYFKGHIFKFFAKKGYVLERVALYGGESEAIFRGQKLVAEGQDKGQVLISVYDERANLAVLDDGRLGIALGIEQLIEDVMENEIDHVIICLPSDAKKRVKYLQEEFSRVAVKISFMPIDLDERFEPIVLDDVPVYGWELIIKSVFDRVATVCGLLVISPFLCLIALAIKLDSKGSVLFKQERTGYNNQSFTIYKFRTMYGVGEDGKDARQARPGDKRITKVGKFLRHWSLDELPQLFNVIKGDMSLVGPRPHPKGVKAGDVEFEQAVMNYKARHRIKPGITGWAQVNGLRGATETKEKLAERVKYDTFYIKQFSLSLDFYILFKTVYTVLKGENAH